MRTRKKTQPDLPFTPSKKSLSYGGELRKTRRGRGQRPLSTKNSHHIVFKVLKNNLRNKSFRHPKNFKLVQKLLQTYAQRFYIAVDQISYQHDHIHILARSGRRSNFHNFFRVFAGQLAQSLKVTDTPLWKHRPFSRLVIGLINLLIAKDYIQLNEKEVTGIIAYSKDRLRGLTSHQRKLLWS